MFALGFLKTQYLDLFGAGLDSQKIAKCFKYCIEDFNIVPCPQLDRSGCRQVGLFRYWIKN